MTMNIIFIILVIIFSLILVYYSFLFGLWLKAKNAGIYISPFRLISMRFVNINPSDIINSAIMLNKAGIKISLDQLESHYLAGGSVSKVALGLIAAKKEGIDLNFKTASAIDLANYDVCNAVSICSKSKVIDTPLVVAKTKNGNQIKIIAHVTINADINKLIGGATEDIILERVSECIVTTISSFDSPEEIYENPNIISKFILEKGVDSNTAFKIISIDISFK